MSQYLLTAKDLQEYMGIGRDYAYALMHSSAFPSMKLSGRYFVTPQALEEWLSQNKYKTFKL